jgi:hypothetical protein
LVLVLVALAAMWVYALFFADASASQQVPDRAWAARAEAACSVTDGQLAALPPAMTFAKVTPISEALRQRADVGQKATDLLADMVGRLRADPPADTVSRAGLDLWLADWDTYLADRQHHIVRWRRGEDPQFVESARDGRPVTLRMDAFATANRMKSCRVPQDFG